jgi:hypothetical protein
MLINDPPPFPPPPPTRFLSPAPARLPPALALAIAAGVDILPGASLGFGLAGDISPLAAARVEGGGMTAGSPAAVNAGGSVGALASALAAGVLARAPYAHHALAMSQPFPTALPAWMLGGGSRGFSASSLSPTAHAAQVAAAGLRVPVASPLWLPALVALGSRGSWSRVPLPVSPFLSSRSSADDAASASVRDADGVTRQPLLAVAGDGVSQAIFSSRSLGGASIVLFFTAVLVPLDAPLPPGVGGAASSASSSAGGPAAPALAAWQVSLQIRTDDARVRALFAAEIHEWVHALFCGRLSVLSHGHSPSAASLLRRLDLVAPPPEAAGGSAAYAAATAEAQDGAAGVVANANAPMSFVNVLLAPPVITLEALTGGRAVAEDSVIEEEEGGDD